MAVATKPRSPFGDLLREALEEQHVTIRELSRRLARHRQTTNGNGHVDPESIRRMLQRYIRGEVSPGADVRDQLADELQVDRGRFAEDREHEERRRRLVAALQPLADELLFLATHTRERPAE